MTSFINLPAIYHYAHSTNTDMYTAYCEGVIIGQSFSKDECEWIAKKHYIANKQEK